MCGRPLDVIYNSYLAFLRGEDIAAYRNRFMLIPEDTSESDRLHILHTALALATTKEKTKDGQPKDRAQYVEGRIYRPHEARDFVDLNAGQAELLAATAVPEDDEPLAPSGTGTADGRPRTRLDD